MQEPKKPRGGKREGAGGPRNKVREELEEALGVSARRVQQIVKELGLDRIRDMAELRLVEKRVIIGLRTIQSKREEHLLDVAQRNVLPSDEVLRVGQQVGLVFSQGLNDWLSRMPCELAGRTELQIYETLRREIGDVMAGVNRQLKAIA